MINRIYKAIVTTTVTIFHSYKLKIRAKIQQKLFLLKNPF